MASLKVDFINRALTRTGNSVISTENDTSAEAVVTCANYEGIVENELSHPWVFAKKWFALNRNNETPLSVYRYSWRLPADVLTLRRIGLVGSRTPIDFERDERNVYCDAERDVIALYSYRPDETLWPAYFVELIVRGLEWVCAKGLNESRTSAADAELAWKQQRLIARNIDAKQQSGRDPFEAPLVERHRA